MPQPDPVPQPLDHILSKGDAHAPALVLRSGTLDYAALDALVGRAAAGLRARGLDSGDRVAACLAKTQLACIMPLAAARAGLIYCLLYTSSVRLRDRCVDLCDDKLRRILFQRLEAGILPDRWGESFLFARGRSQSPA